MVAAMPRSEAAVETGAAGIEGAAGEKVDEKISDEAE
jgi:hypothetical protein